MVKQRIRELNMMEATHRAQVIMDQFEASKIGQLLDEFNGGSV
jgi:hypothetical protein